ncbi:MAG TPA: GNAT family N-acetyltransferase [Chitinophagaceae bacterium]|nr:GNAT family N-acetyltransferase [Chitinophagaceae bacterium]
MNRENFLVSTDKSKLDLNYVQSVLSKTYWAEGIPIETVEKAVNGSICFGIYDKNKQIGFARLITDAATFAYLADVFIDAAYQGKGLGKWLIEEIMKHESVQGLRRFMLATKDAHGLYDQYGFVPLTNTERWMHIHNPDVYKNKVK